MSTNNQHCSYRLWNNAHSVITCKWGFHRSRSELGWVPRFPRPETGRPVIFWLETSPHCSKHTPGPGGIMFIISAFFVSWLVIMSRWLVTETRSLVMTGGDNTEYLPWGRGTPGAEQPWLLSYTGDVNKSSSATRLSQRGSEWLHKTMNSVGESDQQGREIQGSCNSYLIGPCPPSQVTIGLTSV